MVLRIRAKWADTNARVRSQLCAFKWRVNGPCVDHSARRHSQLATLTDKRRSRFRAIGVVPIYKFKEMQ